jgi:ribosomal protein L2
MRSYLGQQVHFSIIKEKQIRLLLELSSGEQRFISSKCFGYIVINELHLRLGSRPF